MHLCVRVLESLYQRKRNKTFGYGCRLLDYCKNNVSFVVHDYAPRPVWAKRQNKGVPLFVGDGKSASATFMKLGAYFYNSARRCSPAPHCNLSRQVFERMIAVFSVSQSVAVSSCRRTSASSGVSTLGCGSDDSSLLVSPSALWTGCSDCSGVQAEIAESANVKLAQIRSTAKNLDILRYLTLANSPHNWCQDRLSRHRQNPLSLEDYLKTPWHPTRRAVQSNPHS